MPFIPSGTFLGSAFGRGADAGESSAIVSGAGTAAANGTYTYRGQSLGYPYYNLVGQPDDPDVSSVDEVGDDGRFKIKNSAGVGLYVQTTNGHSFPWEGTWGQEEGALPVPTVTEG